MRSGVSLPVTASHRYRYPSTSWRHPFTRCSPLKTSAFYWSVANSVAGFVYAIQGAAASPARFEARSNPGVSQSQSDRRHSVMSGGIHSPTSAARSARSTSPTPGSARACRCSTMRAANTARTSGARLRQRVAEKRLLVPRQRHDACSTASAASVTRWEPPRIASKHLDALARLHSGVQTDVARRTGRT